MINSISRKYFIYETLKPSMGGILIYPHLEMTGGEKLEDLKYRALEICVRGKTRCLYSIRMVMDVKTQSDLLKKLINLL